MPNQPRNLILLTIHRSTIIDIGQAAGLHVVQVFDSWLAHDVKILSELITTVGIYRPLDTAIM